LEVNAIVEANEDAINGQLKNCHVVRYGLTGFMSSVTFLR